MDQFGPPPGSASTFIWTAEWGKRLAATLAILLVARLGNFIPLPGLDPAALAYLAPGNGIAFARISVFALGLMPFVSGWLLAEVFAGHRDEREIAQVRRRLTAAVALVQGLGVARGLEQVRNLVDEPGLAFQLCAATTMMTGTLLLLWLGEQITKTGFCDGVWLIVAAGFLSELPTTVAQVLTFYWGAGGGGSVTISVVIMLAVLPLTMLALAVLFELAWRHLPLVEKGTQLSAGTYPVKVEQHTLLAASIAVFLLTFPMTIVSLAEGPHGPLYGELAAALGRGNPISLVLYGTLLAAATYVAAAGYSSPSRHATKIDEKGKALPGVPLENAVEVLDGILSRLATILVPYVLAICLLPEIAMTHMGLPILVGGTSMIIVVIVMLDILARAPRGPVEEIAPTKGDGG